MGAPHSDQLVCSSGDEPLAVIRNAGGQDSGVVLQLQDWICQVGIDAEEAQSALAACRDADGKLGLKSGKRFLNGLVTVGRGAEILYLVTDAQRFLQCENYYFNHLFDVYELVMLSLFIYM